MANLCFWLGSFLCLFMGILLIQGAVRPFRQADKRQANQERFGLKVSLAMIALAVTFLAMALQLLGSIDW